MARMVKCNANGILGDLSTFYKVIINGIKLMNFIRLKVETTDLSKLAFLENKYLEMFMSFKLKK